MSDNVYQQVDLFVSNVAAGQVIRIELAEQGAPVEWSSGPGLSRSAGVRVRVLSGSILLESLNISAEEIRIKVADSRDPGGVLGVDLTLYLVARMDIHQFIMRSRSDPGISVQASLGSSSSWRQNVTSTDTIFSWRSD